MGPSAWDTVPTHTYIHITGPGWSMVYTTADPGSACPRAESPKFQYFLIFHQPKGCFPPDRQKVLKFTLRGSGGYTTFKGISLRLLGGSPRADRARCQLANPTTQRRQGVAEAARWGFHCGREGHRGLPGPFLRAAPEPFLTDFGVRGHLARLGARLAQPPDRPRAAPAPRRRAPGVCPGAADTLSRGAGGPGLAGGAVMSP